MMKWFALFLLIATSSWAVEPNEMLDDRSLEARAQSLDKIIRCVKCRSESIASSNADWARDARIRLRSMLSSGASDQEVLDAFVLAYGEVVLMRPSRSGANMVLWVSGPVLLMIGLIVALRFQRSQAAVSSRLSEEEKSEIDRLIASNSRTPNHW